MKPVRMNKSQQIDVYDSATRPQSNGKDLLWLQFAVLVGGMIVWLFGDWLLP
jgi:hypothetical protein